jgi:hypothetical protein
MPAFATAFVSLLRKQARDLPKLRAYEIVSAARTPKERGFGAHPLELWGLVHRLGVGITRFDAIGARPGPASTGRAFNFGGKTPIATEQNSPGSQTSTAPDEFEKCFEECAH